MIVNDLFLRETFLLQLAAQHGQTIATHVDTWLQAPWCDSWFHGAREDTNNFILPVLSWSQFQDTLEPLVDPDNTPDPTQYTFLVLKWQGIARLHHDKIAHRVLPTLSAHVNGRMQWYFDKRNTVLHHTTAIPRFLPTDQFLSYRLCPPLVKDWLKKLEYPILAELLPSFPWLHTLAPLTIDPTKDYAEVALDFVSEDPTLEHPAPAPAAQPIDATDPTTTSTTIDFLRATFQFSSSSSPVESPSSRTQQLQGYTPPPQLNVRHVVTGPTATPRALFQSQQLGASAFLPTSQPLQGRDPILNVPSHVSTMGRAQPG